MPFTGLPFIIFKVNCKSAEIFNYVDVLLELDGAVVTDLLLVVEGLAYFLLIGTDILRLQNAMLTLNEVALL